MKKQPALLSGNCIVCKVELSDHPHCLGCGILFGPQHYEITPTGYLHGQPFCGSCTSYVQVRKAL